MIMQILSVLGTRPEAIKMARVLHALSQHPDFNAQVCITGQHREILNPMLDLFDITPDHRLDVMSDNQSLSVVTAKLLSELQVIYQKQRPDLVLVQGDAASTFAACLAAYYQGIPVAHIEAGLRSHNIDSPFPEEANRRFISRIARWHFAPTALARSNLMAESIPSDRIHVTGNTGIDTLLWMKNRVISKDFSSVYGSANDILHSGLPIVLITGHRRECFGEDLEGLCRAIAHMARKHADWQFIYPVHLNPNVHAPVHQYLSNIYNVHLIAPLEYAPFVQLMNRAKFIITDSGGIQEEAPSLGKPVIVTRSVTERPEGLEAGSSVLVGSDFEQLVIESESLMQDDARYAKMMSIKNPYGDGQAVQRIVGVLEDNFLKKGP
jgi:UDP-N-acetylglucosamine 2-epimerase (non-hydrolysing)